MSGERVREIRLQTARELEQRGFADKAIDQYKKAGAPGEAVRLLVGAERYVEAGTLMLETLGVSPDDAGRLEGRSRAAAEKAARCFELGGDTETAARVRRALGAPEGAARAAHPSIAPDVLPQTEPVPSIAPPAASSPPSVARGHAVSPSPSSPGMRVPESTRPVVSSSPSMVGIPAARSIAPSPARPSTPAPASQPRAPSITPSASRAPGSADKWGRASGWRGGAQGSGATDEMIRQLLEQGKKNAAARVAWDSGRLEDAAQWFAESGLDYESGAVLYDLGRHAEAMEALLRVSPDHKRHRVACTKLVDIASKLGRFDFELDRVLTQFAKAPPIEPTEVPTYLTLAELYARNGFADGARRVLEQVLSFDASHEQARAALDALPPAAQPKRGTSIPPARMPARAIVAPGTRALPALPTLEAFVAEAKKHAPRRDSR
ncbi:hypothetical protein [Sandaracinus amylolyticus]|uniref:Uncharacterized protein n=1 Tax=Sandaracinus amylolyticus TaxID=927083 RepID=A0A0F6YGV2_9BACT|nr:hypothetical protein [Sandaracinus amylolyticus]AKF04088.1 hypothetical protein DB32_001237 [Sandaracinus amylolyticus]